MISITNSKVPVYTQSLVIFCTKDSVLSYSDDKIKELYNKLKETKILGDEKYSLFSSFVTIEDTITSVTFVVVGSEKDYNSNTIQRCAYIGVKDALKFKPQTISVCLFDNNTPLEQQKTIEGALFATYKYDKYHLNKDEASDYTLNFVKPSSIDSDSLRIGKSLAYNIFAARDIVNEPANDMTPEALANYVLNHQNKGYTAFVYDESKIQELKMGAFYGVAKGSKNPPRLIVMKYMGYPESNEIIGLIGKGLTYDSGGYSLKPTSGMKTMKADMGGAASVIAAISTLAETKAKVNVIAIVAACENLISDHSYKPGDILHSMAGKYIEVDNTDAEGRLTLIDAVTYAIREQNVTAIVDVATLTGAAVAAFGKEYTPVLANRENIWEILKESSKSSGDKIWRLPLDDNLGKLNKSEIADLKNSGGSFAGTITAGMFIGEFVEDKPWAHLDIAGPAFVDDDKEFCGSKATGVPTSLLCEFAIRYFKSIESK